MKQSSLLYLGMDYVITLPGVSCRNKYKDRCCSWVHDVILIEQRLEERPHGISRYLANLASRQNRIWNSIWRDNEVRL